MTRQSGGRSIDNRTIAPEDRSHASSRHPEVTKAEPRRGRRTPHALNARHEVHHGSAGSDGAIIRIQHLFRIGWASTQGSRTMHQPSPTAARLSGIWLPLITPFVDGRLDEASLTRLATHYAHEQDRRLHPRRHHRRRSGAGRCGDGARRRGCHRKRWHGASRCSSGCAAAIRGGWSGGWQRRRSGRWRDI